MSLKGRSVAPTSALSPMNLIPGLAAALVPPSFKPTTKLAVSFGDKAASARPRRGSPFPPEADEAETEAPADASYFLILTDPDAPTPDDPKFAFWRHWVVSGLKPSVGEDEGESSAQEGKTLTEYLGPGPKDDSKPHRYHFLLYREPSGLSLSKADVGGEEFVQRRSFQPPEFAEKHGLRLVAVNWMTCAGDGWTG
ncbi:PEBP-like protein [Hypoxylon sp. FL1857]|nr:PEBP-like protein [Hypoxylon sp. FL1857]